MLKGRKAQNVCWNILEPHLAKGCVLPCFWGRIHDARSVLRFPEGSLASLLADIVSISVLTPPPGRLPVRVFGSGRTGSLAGAERIDVPVVLARNSPTGDSSICISTWNAVVSVDEPSLLQREQDAGISIISVCLGRLPGFM